MLVRQPVMLSEQSNISIVLLKLHSTSPATAAYHIFCHCIGMHAFFVLMTLCFAPSNLHGQRCTA